LFASGEALLDFGVTVAVDCLLLDIHLGGISGIELHRRLRASGCLTPVVFMTAIDDEAMRQQALASGCIAFLKKPFPAYLLFEALDKAAA
jgi:FixJ family two-component response regulator